MRQILFENQSKACDVRLRAHTEMVHLMNACMKSWQGVIEPQNKRFLMDDSLPAVLLRRDVSFDSKTIVLIFAKKACFRAVNFGA